MFKWLRDARYGEVQIQLKHIRADFEMLQAKFEALKSQMQSTRGFVNSKLRQRKTAADEDFDEDESSSQPSSAAALDELKKAFGGDIPIELTEKYKNLGFY